MRILYLATDVFDKGGIQRYARYQFKALKETPSIVEKAFIFSLLGQTKDSFEEDISLDYIAGGLSLFKKISFALKTIFFARREKINLIICNHVSLTPIARFLKSFFGVPYIVNVYGLEMWSGLNKSGVKGLKEAKAVIGDCRFTLKYINKNFGISEEKLFLLYDCVALEKFHPQIVPREIYDKYGIVQNKKIISVVGRLVYDKGQETMIRFLKYLSDDIILLNVGGGKRLEEWKELARSEGVSNRVVFTGRVPEEDLIPLYNASDLIVFLSQFKPHEGCALPLVLIEAAACEKPIIVSNEDGACEAVKDGFNGFIVPARDKEIIVNKIKYLFSNPSLLKQMGKNSREYVRENFSYEIFRRNQEAILKKVLPLK